MLRRLLLLVACGACWSTGVAWAASITLVASESSPSYVAAAQALTLELERLGISRADVAYRTASDTGLSDANDTVAPRLYVSLGIGAFKHILGRDQRAPVIAMLLPRSGFERVFKDSGRKGAVAVSALYLDQPFGRQLDLIRLVLPEAKRVGVVWGQDSLPQQPALGLALQSRGLQEVSGFAGSSAAVYAGLRSALDDVDVLLAVADPQVYNSTTIANILLATYRGKVPVMAFSPSYVKAGALMSLHTTPEQMGAQAALMVRTALQSTALPAPQYPMEFSVSVNEHVARSLGLTLEASYLTERLRKLEIRP